jgi:hypothetical protein
LNMRVALPRVPSGNHLLSVIRFKRPEGDREVRTDLDAARDSPIRLVDGAFETTDFLSKATALLVGLPLLVEDNGPEIPNEATRPGAFGLISVRRRLALR